MQRNFLFLQHRIQREIDWSGAEYTFTHKEEDKYHREASEVSYVVKGIFHQATSYKNKNSDNGSVTSTKPSPMILCMYQDGAQVSIGDTVIINKQDYLVTGIQNVQELNVAFDISLELNE